MNTFGSPLTRRGFLAGSAGLASLAALNGCARGSSAASNSSDPKSMTFVTWQDAGVDPLLPDLLAAFKAASGITVEQQASIPFQDYQLRFRTSMAGNAPADVMNLNDNFLREMAGKNTLVDLTTQVDAGDFAESWFESAYDFPLYNNGRYGVAIGQQPNVIYYNKTMFESAGVPLPPTTWTDENWKWDEFLETAKALTRGDDVYGVSLINATPAEHIWPVNNGGTGTFSADGKSFAMADEVGHTAIQWVADLALVHKVAIPWSILAPDTTEANRMFIAGRLGMMLGNLTLVNYLRSNARDFEWDVAPIPGNARQQQETGFVVWVIPGKAKNPEAAWEFLKYISGPQGGKVFAEHAAMIPANKEAADQLTGQADTMAPAHLNIFIEATDHHTMVPDTTGTAAAQALYRPVLGLIWSGEVTAKDGLGGVRPQVEAAISAQ